MKGLSRIWNALRGNRLSSELDREMAFHLAEREDDLVSSGMSPKLAAREARRRFGNYGSLKERTRDVDVATWLDTLAADVRYALRALRASPGFATVAILSLALGIGANSAIFTLINAVMLQAIPVTRPHELVSISRDGRYLTEAIWQEIRARQSVFSDVFAYTSVSVDLSNGGESHNVPAGLATGELFPTLGIRTALGRPLSLNDDNAANCQHVAVVTDDFWRTELGASPTAVGRTITLDGKPFQIVGVAAPPFFGVEIGYHIPVWAPLCSEQILRGESGITSTLARMVIGRMKPGVTLAGVTAQLAALRPAILEATVQYSAPKSGILLSPNEYRKTQFNATSFTNGDPALRNTYGDALIALMGVVGVVLLIACANVANLLLARATARQREIAVRLALGASRGRLVRQLLTESTVLAGLGALGGGLFAWWGSRLLVSLLTTSAQRVAIHLTPDWRVVAFTAVVAVGTGLLFGLAPAWRSARVSAGATMRPTGRGVVEGHSRFGVGKLLVAGQIALSLVAVTAAGLLLGSWIRLATVDPGYATDGMLIVGARQGGTTQFRDILERVRALPGVRGAAYSAYTPLSDAWNTTISVAGAANSTNGPIVRMNDVTDGYFDALDTPLLAGRDFGAQDTPSSPRVAIVSENLAREFLGGPAALGKRVRFGSPPGEPVEIVGIVGDTKQTALRFETDPVVYFPFSQDTSAQSSVSFAIHASGAPSTLTSAVNATFAEVDSRISYRVTTLARRIENAVRLPKTLGVLAGFFGGLALLLAAIGLYGIMAYTVARRRNEIGIRVALGAERGRIVRLVLGDVARIVAFGTVAGVVLSLATTRVGRSLLYGVAPNDPIVLGAAAGLLAAAAVVAGAIPARRAARLDAMTALRVD
jgi:predicted permease